MNCIFCTEEIKKSHCSKCKCNFYNRNGELLSITFYTDEPSSEFEYIDYILNIKNNELIIQYLTTTSHLHEIVINHIPDINPDNLFEVFQRLHKLNAFL